jgi:ketosteroid isomerase-like protein
VSQENLDTLLSGYEWLRVNGRFPAHLATPDFVWDLSNFEGALGQLVYGGAQGAQDFLTEWTSAWDDWEMKIEATHDVDDKVVAIVHQQGRSKITGIPVESMMAHVWTFRDGQLTRMDMYSDPSEALKAVGLEQ